MYFFARVHFYYSYTVYLVIFAVTDYCVKAEGLCKSCFGYVPPPAPLKVFHLKVILKLSIFKKKKKKNIEWVLISDDYL